MVERRTMVPSVSAVQEPILSKEEKWRLMQESDHPQVPDGPGVDEIEEQDSPLAEEIFNAITMIVPFSFLLLMMEILIRHQYGKHPGLDVLVERMVSNVPILALLIFYTMRYKEHRRLQIGLFLASVGIGCRVTYLLSRGSLYVNIRQIPPLCTLWIYAIVQLELGPALLNLATVAAYVWWNSLKLLR
ncbi:uncharacterized protein EV420DRAFT_1497560 [Desarmillaria tabescens]|uniref:DUF7719 domain-containing protein n=1 Tax=Armillaria tabescens TaxID=1929756 RepID=A0AA39T7J1_ARMTA|nr:uncharacterized protein EV420DRAFT_1497560 [Desarmillaria tabescens]KAK0469931.1 hypothetical protein EV420DRAFT_1497560 [Desarmillaria tabescens]